MPVNITVDKNNGRIIFDIGNRVSVSEIVAVLSACQNSTLCTLFVNHLNKVLPKATLDRIRKQYIVSITNNIVNHADNKDKNQIAAALKPIIKSY